MATCDHNPECREDLINKIDTKLSIKTLIASLAVVVAVISVIATIGYNSYSSRSYAQNAQNEAIHHSLETSIKENAKDIRTLDKTQGQITTRLESIDNNQQDIKRALRNIYQALDGNPSRAFDNGDRDHDHE